MEAAPHGLFIRQAKQLSLLAQTLAQVVRDQPGYRELCACAHEIQRDADAVSLAKGIELLGADACKAVPQMAPQARPRPQSAGSRSGAAGCNTDSTSLGTVRVGDFRQDLDALCAQMRRARADLDSLGCSSRRQDELATQSITEIKQLRSDLKDMQEALVTHDNDLQQLAVASKAASKKIDTETEAWRAATVRDAAELRQMLKGVSEDVDAEFQRFQQAFDAGLSEDKKLINKFAAELRAEISGVSAATNQETKECIKEYGAEQERHLASAEARFSEQLTEGLSKYAEGLRIEIRELRGRVEAELTSCRQEQSLASQRFSHDLDDVNRTSRRAVEEVTDLQKTISQIGTELNVIQRGVEDARHTATQATESACAQFEMRMKESQQAANECGMQQIEQQAETMATIITRVVGEARVEFDATVASLSARLDESSAEQLASSQSLAAAQEELERQLRDCAVVVGQHADETNNRVAAKLEDLEGRSLDRTEELKNWMVSQLVKIEQTTHELKESQAVSGGHHSLVTESLKEDIDHKLTDVRNTLSDVQREISGSVRSLENELTSSRKAYDAKFSQLIEDLNDVRQRFDSPDDFDATKAKEAAERVESAARHSATEIAATLKSMREQVRSDHESLGVELRGLLAHSEQRFRLGVDAVQSRLDEVQNTARRTQSDASTEIQRLQAGLGEAEKTLCTLLSSVDNIKLNAESAARGSMNQAQGSVGEMKAHEEELRQLRFAGDILASGVQRIAQVIGLLPGLDHVEDARFQGSILNLGELLRWESEGNPLVKRLESAWQPRTLAQGGSVLDALQRKAEQSTLRLVQSALRDLDVRVSHMRTGGALEGLGPPPWLGKSGAPGIRAGEKVGAGIAESENKSPTLMLNTEAQDWRPQLIPRPPSAPPSRNTGEEGPHTRRIAGAPLGGDNSTNLPSPM
eukprot:gnl/MRDRNA2_/MRDRNA2_95987_c0_seq1.p1 gnl/MRDRNA2_/MRDRNA2_95987_c0~~gnl/MRDRNA2_/MRDRNA2_95987_c0_seq1.p1  ORF type:complete len:927 (+),score=221.39 gnl/MRDRNA2_/MRDRNA2_95987_c0_seq1:56-2836(+)